MSNSVHLEGMDSLSFPRTFPRHLEKLHFIFTSPFTLFSYPFRRKKKMEKSMASFRLLGVVLPLVLLSWLLVFNSPTAQAAEKVTLALYYETLCPYCSRFIVKGLTKLFQTDLINVVDLKLVPYGNAKITANGDITCQHGEYECILNTVEACAINAWPELNKHFPFIYCVERLVVEGNYKEWESCFGKLGLDATPIQACYKSEIGKKLEFQYANDTGSLQPPHTYVPWVVVDGQPLYEDYEDFVAFVCKAYKGTAQLKACEEPSLGIIAKTEEDQMLEVCYMEDTRCLGSAVTVPRKTRAHTNAWKHQLKIAKLV